MIARRYAVVASTSTGAAGPTLCWTRSGATRLARKGNELFGSWPFVFQVVDIKARRRETGADL